MTAHPHVRKQFLRHLKYLLMLRTQQNISSIFSSTVEPNLKQHEEYCAIYRLTESRFFYKTNFGQSFRDLCFRTADLLSCFNIYSLIIRIHFHASMVSVEMMSTNDSSILNSSSNSSLVLINQLGCGDCDLKQQISSVL